MKQSLRTIALLAGMGALAACDNLETLEQNQCGNTVIERGEDCDGAGLGDNVCNESCRLECTAVGACPPGWGCGADGLCRQPTGLFEPLGNSVPVSGDRLSLADVDGDGRSDVVATRGGSVTIAFADAAGLSPEVTNITFSTIDADPDIPAAGDVDGDGRVDFALRFGTSLGVLRGQQDRTLSPQLFARRLAVPLGDSDVLVAVDVDESDAAPGEELLVFGETGLRVAHTSDDETFPDDPLLTWEKGTPKPLGRFGDQQMFGFEGSGEIHFFVPALQTVDGAVWNTDGMLAPETVLGLPGGATVKGRPSFRSVFFQDTTSMGTGNATMFLVPGEDGGQDSLFYTFLGAGGFVTNPLQTTPEDTLAEVTLSGPSGVESAPLAFTDIQEDSVPDLAGPGGLFVSKCEPLNAGTDQCALPFDPLAAGSVSLDYELALAPDVGDRWTSFQEVGAGLFYLGSVYEEVLVTTEKPGFLLYRNLGSPYLTTFRIPTSSAVKNVVRGDFNADGSRDIAFSQISRRSKPGGPLLESVHISFGDEIGLPSPPVDLGDVGEVQQMFAATLFPTKSGKSVVVSEGDGVNDLVVRGTANGVTSTYVFAGSTDGQIQSPLDLGSACAGENAPSGVPRFSALADLSGEGTRDLAVVFRRQDASGAVEGYDLWSLRPGAGDNDAICASLVGPAELPDLGGTALSVLPADLDADGIDEVVMFAAGSSSLLLGKLTGEGWVVKTIELGAPYLGVVATPVFSTVAASSATSAPLDLVLWSEGSVTVLRNDGTLALDAEGAARVSPPAKGCALGAEGPPAAITGVAAVHLHPDEGRELVIFTEQETLVAEIEDPASGRVGPARCAPLIPGDGGAAVTSGDVDGDGVEDLVVARPGGIQVLAGIPVVR